MCGEHNMLQFLFCSTNFFFFTINQLMKTKKEEEEGGEREREG